MNSDEVFFIASYQLEKEFQQLDLLDDHLKFYHANISEFAAELLIQQFKQNNQSNFLQVNFHYFEIYKYNKFYLIRHKVRNISTERRSI